jgi:hypothetical protein
VQGEIYGLLRASFYHGAKIRNSAVLPLAGNLLGSAFPKPCYAACAAYPRRAHEENQSRREKAETKAEMSRFRAFQTRINQGFFRGCQRVRDTFILFHRKRRSKA